MPQLSATVKTHLIQLMGKTEHICLTVDLWSNPSIKSFFGMTGHFIIDFVMQSVVLSCQCFKGRHTAENIFKVYEDVLENYNIQDKI